MKKLSFVAFLAVFCASLSATVHVSKPSLSDLQLRKAATSVRNFPFNALMAEPAAKKAPSAALANYDFSNNVTFVEASYFGTATYDIDDWVFYFAGASNNLIAYVDAYIGDGTHIDGSCQMADYSIYECSIVKAPGDTVDAVNATLTIQHSSTYGYYDFSLNATDAANNTYVINGTYPVDAYDYYYYYVGYDDEIILEDLNSTPGGGTTPSADYTGEPAAPAPVNATFSGNDAEWDESYYAKYGDVDLYLYDIDTTHTAALYFYVPSSYTTGPIPAGTYSINDSYDEWTVEASSGREYNMYLGGYAPTAALYATINGDYYQNIWYLVSGYVQVSYDANGKQTVIVNAISGNGSNVIVTYTEETGVTPPVVDPIDPESGFFNADAKINVLKNIENGQVVIYRNGVRYNTLGLRF